MSAAPYALMWSGGKDSYLALVRAKRQALGVTTLVNFYDGPTGRVRFHATRKDLVAAQAFALGLRLHQHATTGDGYEAALREALNAASTTPSSTTAPSLPLPSPGSPGRCVKQAGSCS